MLIIAPLLALYQAVRPTPWVWTGTNPSSGYRVAARGNLSDSTGATVTIDALEKVPGPSITVMATRAAAPFHLQRIRLAGQIQLSNANYGGWISVRVDNALGETTDVGEAIRVGSGTTLWRPFETRLTVPGWAKTIHVTVMPPGKGQLAIRGLRVSLSDGDPSAVAIAPLIQTLGDRLNGGADSGEVIDRLTTIERLFQQLWFTSRSIGDPAGLLVETDPFTPPPVRRLQTLSSSPTTFVHCHPDGSPDGVTPQQKQFLIPARVGHHAICPSWLVFPSSPLAGDERVNVDTAVAEARRDSVRHDRARVIAALRRARDAFPAHNRITGQLIRFLVDQRDTVGAQRAADECRADSWWCAALAGYVAHARLDVPAADAFFARALRSAPDTTRCEWTDLSVLLPESERALYGRTPCAGRDSLNAVVWWLADPLYMEAGNARRVEHYARQVSVAVRSAVEQDAPYDWSPQFGGGAVRTMMVRYGPPTTELLLGIALTGHQTYLGTPRPLYFTTSEYSRSRVHALAAWSAVMSPYTARVSDWELTASAALRLHPDLDLWWPPEHSARDPGPLVQLFDHQLAMFRREDEVLVAMAAELPPDLLGAPAGAPGHGSLVASAAPDTVRLAPVQARVGMPVRAQAMIEARPHLIGLEVALDGAPATAARTRFGITPPEPLSRLSAGAIAVSDVALVDGDPDATGSNAAAALSRMLGRTDLIAPTRLGLYWETYGLSATEPVDIAVQMERLDRPGVLRRLEEAFRLVGSSAASVSPRWHETEAGNGATVIAGRVPTLGRMLMLDVSSFAPGRYAVRVAVSRPGGVAVTSTRDFTIAPR